jgi:hypothetical protein
VALVRFVTELDDLGWFCFMDNGRVFCWFFFGLTGLGYRGSGNPGKHEGLGKWFIRPISIPYLPPLIIVVMGLQRHENHALIPS